MKKKILLSLILFVIIFCGSMSFAEELSPFQRAKVRYYMEMLRERKEQFPTMTPFKLMDFGNPLCIPVLVEAMQDKDRYMRTNVICALSAFVKDIRKNPELLEKIVPLLIQSLRDEDNAVRTNARNILFALEGRRQVKKSTKALSLLPLNHPDKKIASVSRKIQDILLPLENKMSWNRFPEEEIEKTVQRCNLWWEENKKRMIEQARKVFKEEKTKQTRQLVIEKENPAIAICFLSADPSDKELSLLFHKIEDYVIEDFSKIENIQLLEWAETRLLLQERGLSELGLTEIISKAISLGADYFIFGAFYREKGKIVLEVDLFAISSGRFIELYKGKGNLENLSLAKAKITESFKSLLPKGEGESRREASHKEVRLAVMDLQTYDRDKQNLGKGLTSFLIQQLSRIENIKVVSRQEIERIRGEFEEQKAGWSEAENFKIGKLLNADVIVLGNYEIENGKILIRVRLVETDTGKITGVRSVSGNLKSLENLQKNLSSQIAEEIKSQDTLSQKGDNKSLARLYLKRALDEFGYKNKKAALLWTENAIFLNPDSLEAQDFAAHLYEFTKNYPKAIDKYLYLLSKYPQERAVPDWLCHLGYIYYSQGQKEKAIFYLEELIDKYLQFNPGKDAVFYRMLKDITGEEKFKSRVVNAYCDGVSSSIKNGSYFNLPFSPSSSFAPSKVAYDLADYYDNKEDFPQALKFYQLSVSLAPFQPHDLLKRLYHIGEIYEEMNNIPKALEFYQEILGKLKMRRGMSKRDREFQVKIEGKIKELEGKEFP